MTDPQVTQQLSISESLPADEGFTESVMEALPPVFNRRRRIALLGIAYLAGSCATLSLFPLHLLSLETVASLLSLPAVPATAAALSLASVIPLLQRLRR